MNIIFIDSDNNFEKKLEQFMYSLFGFYYRKMNNIYYLSINPDKRKNSFLNWLLKIKFKREVLHIVSSKKIDLNTDIVSNLYKVSSNIINVTEQNNLLYNDKKYIEKYLSRNNILKKNASILFVIDRLDVTIKSKIIELVKEYRTVDIYTIGKALYFDTKDFVEKINEDYGSTIETLDKMPDRYYNSLLVFSKEDIKIPDKSSFVLDYNNSDLDIESNTYKVYLKNIKEIEKIFFELKMNISNFKKTKLGKLYIHKEWNTLDK